MRSVRSKVCGIPMPLGVALPEQLFLPDFYMQYDALLLRLEIASMLNAKQDLSENVKLHVIIENGVQCPSPRVCLSAGEAGYLYDRMKGSAFHILVFGSDLQGPVRQELLASPKNLSDGFYAKFGGRKVFNIVRMTKHVPFEMKAHLMKPGMSDLKNAATVVYDDRPPDEDAHYTFTIDYSKRAVVVTRPDLRAGMSIFPSKVAQCLSTSNPSGRTSPSPPASGSSPASPPLAVFTVHNGDFMGKWEYYMPWSLIGGLLMLALNVMLYNISISMNAGYSCGAEVLGCIGTGLFMNAPFSVRSVARGANGNSVRVRVHHVRPGRRDCPCPSNGQSDILELVAERDPQEHPCGEQGGGAGVNQWSGVNIAV